MRVLLLSAALALASGALPPQEPAQLDGGQSTDQDTEPSAPPKAPVAGMSGFRSKSRVVLGTEPEQVLRLEAYYVFPERVRWSVLPEGAAATDRQLYSRFGESYWSIAPGEANSQPLGSGVSGESLLRRTDIHMELRRAAMLWPDGLEWDGEGRQRSARSPLKAGVIYVPDPVSLVLFAQLDEAGRPTEMHIHWRLPEGRTIDTRTALLDITWRQQDERWWPHTFTLVGYGEAEWRETVETVETAINALDAFFVPPDRRGELGARPATAPVLVALPPTCQRRVPLTAGTDLETALQDARRLTEAEARKLEALGLALAEGLAVELSDSGGAKAVLLRLSATPATVPEGWERLPARTAASAPRSGRGPVTSRSIDRLRAVLPTGARPGAPYLRIVPIPGAAEVRQLVLPFSRAG